MSPPRSPLILLACAALGVALAACGGSSSGGSAASTSPSPAPRHLGTVLLGTGLLGRPARSSAAASTIAANWATFFNAKTPVAKRVSLLQDGQTFQSIIKSQAGAGLAASATAKVTKVTVTSPTQAKVTYSILIGGQSALANQAGVAVLQDGTWKVGLASFCGLLALENGGKTSGLPAACKSAA